MQHFGMIIQSHLLLVVAPFGSHQLSACLVCCIHRQYILQLSNGYWANNSIVIRPFYFLLRQEIEGNNNQRKLSWPIITLVVISCKSGKFLISKNIIIVVEQGVTIRISNKLNKCKLFCFIWSYVATYISIRGEYSVKAYRVHKKENNTNTLNLKHTLRSSSTIRKNI